MDHDRLFKELIKTFFVDFLQLFLPELAAAVDLTRQVVFLDKEVMTDVTRGKKYTTDLLVKARVHDQDSHLLIHLESQAQKQSDFAARMFRYFARLHELYDLPVYPIALLSYDRPRTREPAHFKSVVAGFHVLHFRFKTIQLNRLRWRNYLKMQNPVACALMAKMAIDEKDRPRVQFECLRLLATLQLDRARMQLISGFVDSYLSLTEMEVQKFRQLLKEIPPEEQQKMLEITTSWKEEGRREGKLEGRREGKLEGKVEGLLEGLGLALKLRFPGSHPSLEGRLAACRDVEVLQEMLTQVELTATAAELDSWLALRLASKPK